MIKNIFSTPKRTAVILGGLFLLLAVFVIGIVLMAKPSMETSSIGEENAKNYAFADAGVDPVRAEWVRSEFGHEQGHFVYEVEFVADNTEYEYWIKAEDGSVVKKQMEMLNISGTDITSVEKSEEESQTVSAPGTADDTGSYIGVDRAKAIALEHAGFSEGEVRFSKVKLENDDGYTVYEVEFYKDRVEYEYKIHAATGEIMEYDMDRDD